MALNGNHKIDDDLHVEDHNAIEHVLAGFDPSNTVMAAIEAAKQAAIAGAPPGPVGPVGPAGPPTTDASALVSGTLDDARLPVTAQASTLAGKLDTTVANSTYALKGAGVSDATVSPLIASPLTSAALNAKYAQTADLGARSVVVAKGASAPAGLPVGTIIIELAV